MPVYEYQCQDCGHQFEASQRITEPKLTDCPECKKPKLERLISSTSFQLKGGGWYRDGYGDKKGGKPRSDNDRVDRLSKAIDEDKKKSAPESGAGGDSSAAPAAAPSSDGGGGGGSSGGDGGGGSSSEKSQAA